MKILQVREADNNSVRFNIFRTVHLPIFLVHNQLDAQFSIIYLFKSSTCFEHLCAHLQEDNCMNTTSDSTTLVLVSVLYAGPY